MKLYHATTCKKIKSIEKYGLLPGKGVLTNEKAVYLTNKQGVKIVGQTIIRKDRCIVVVDIPKDMIGAVDYGYYYSETPKEVKAFREHKITEYLVFGQISREYIKGWYKL